MALRNRSPSRPPLTRQTKRRWRRMAGGPGGSGWKGDGGVEGRRDRKKGTRAAARPLKDLYQQLGDWYLAMGAYNPGRGRVQSGVKGTGSADFGELYRRNVLPKE